MLLTAAVTKAEIVALIEALTPRTIVIDANKGRSVTVGRPRLELVPDAGIRLRGDARITWDVAGMTVPVTLQSWQVMLLPRVVNRGASRMLAFEPVLEELDLKRVPAFLDDKIAKAISDGIAQNKERLVWNFAQRLSKRWPLPKRLGTGAFALTAVDGGIRVTAEEVMMTLRFETGVVAERAPKSARAPGSVRQPEIR